MLFKLTENNRVSKVNIENTLGKEFFDKISESKELLRLDDSLEGFFKKSFLINDFLEKKNLFWRVYERRDKFCHLIKKRCSWKDKVIRGLFSCVVQTFNGYEITGKKSAAERKKGFWIHRYCLWARDRWQRYQVFFHEQYSAFKSYIDKKCRGDYRLLHPDTRQCYYCDNYFACSKNEFLKHVKNAPAKFTSLKTTKLLSR